MAGDGELGEQFALEEVQPRRVGVEDVDNEDFGLHRIAPARLDDLARAVDDPHVVGPLDRPEPLAPRGGADLVQRTVDHLAPLAEALVDRAIGLEEWAKKHGSRDGLGVGVGCRQTRNDRPDAPDLLHRFMRYVCDDHSFSLTCGSSPCYPDRGQSAPTAGPAQRRRGQPDETLSSSGWRHCTCTLQSATGRYNEVERQNGRSRAV